MSLQAKPRYQQLKDLIIQQISTGELRPNDRVPSENQLVETQCVSRMTANRALRELTAEGYVKRIAGRGTFGETRQSRTHFSTDPENHDIAVKPGKIVDQRLARPGHEFFQRLLIVK